MSHGRPVLTDFHAHTTFSDGVLSVEQLIAQVRARGVRPSVAGPCSRAVRGALPSGGGIRG